MTVTLRTGQPRNGRDVNGFHEQPEPGFFKERVFGWLLEGRAPATDPGQPWGPPRGWRAGQKREAQAALNFLKHSRGLREASARLRLWRGPRGSSRRRGPRPLQNSRRCARSLGPRRLRALRASGGESRRQGRRGRANPPQRLTGRSTPSELFLRRRRRTSWTPPQATLADRLRSSREVVDGPSHRERPETRCCAEWKSGLELRPQLPPLAGSPESPAGRWARVVGQRTAGGG